jgi:hypothetical protein
MAIYRQIYITFWQDPFILDLTPEEKYFYLYLMTNSKTRQCGCYELPKKIMELETGYNRETVDKLLGRFVGYKKIMYDEVTSEILLVNWLKYNPINNVNIEKCVLKEMADTKSGPLLSVLEGLIRGYQAPTKKEEQEPTEEQEQEPTEGTKAPLCPYEKIKELYNTKCGDLPKVRIMSEERKKHVKARWKQFNYDIEVFEELFNMAASSKFLSGDNDRKWKADFGWLMNENNMAKVLEGKYNLGKSPQRKEPDYT